MLQRNIFLIIPEPVGKNFRVVYFDQLAYDDESSQRLHFVIKDTA